MKNVVTVGDFLKQFTAGITDLNDEVRSIGTWSGDTRHRYEIHCVNAEGKEYSIMVDER